MEKYIQQVIDEEKECLNKFGQEENKKTLAQISEKVVETLKNGHKILIAGNGGSAADAQHFAAEIVGRFTTERQALPALALTTDTSILTSVGNDYAFDKIFSRQVEGLGAEGDLFIGISTSGNSGNIIEAIKVAQKKRIYTVGMLGKDGGKIKSMCDNSIVVPSNVTARIQEIHGMCIHIMCAFVDQAYDN